MTEDKMNKALQNALTRALANNNWKKFTNPTVALGRTAFPTDPHIQEQLGVRFDFAGKVTGADGKTYNKFKMQPCAGKIPSPIKKWRNDNEGTHAVMADVLVEEDGTMEDVEASLNAAFEKVTKQKEEVDKI